MTGFAGPRLRPDAGLFREAEEAVPRFRRAALLWFRKGARDLPWRKPALGTRRDPYATWISEIMLQQTQVAAVTEYFRRWMRRFPNLPSLARAPEEDVLRHWAGLGYYARARNLHRAARLLASGSFPRRAEELLALPGIGAYTAGAIASLAFDLPEPLLDGNAARVFSRLFGLAFLPGDGRAAKDAYWALAGLWARCRSPGDANESLMELGALACLPVPRCGECPVSRHCLAKQRGWTAQLPPPQARARVESVRGQALVISRRGRVFLEMRPSGSFLAGQLLFPLRLEKPGKASKGDADGAAVRHAIMNRRYELAVRRVAEDFREDLQEKLKGKWVREGEVWGLLTNSLARKIWKAAKSMA